LTCRSSSNRSSPCEAVGSCDVRVPPACGVSPAFPHQVIAGSAGWVTLSGYEVGGSSVPAPEATPKGLGLDGGGERRTLVTKDRWPSVLGVGGVRAQRTVVLDLRGGSGSAAGHPFADSEASMVRSGHDQTGSSRSSPATELCHVDIMRLPAWTPEPAGRPATRRDAAFGWCVPSSKRRPRTPR
jgi:hypothetical protein